MKITAWVHIAKTIGVEIIPERTEKCYAVKIVKTKGIYIIVTEMKVYMCSHLALCVNGILQIIG